MYRVEQQKTVDYLHAIRGAAVGPAFGLDI
jgi:hypothetical protein